MIVSSLSHQEIILFPLNVAMSIIIISRPDVRPVKSNGMVEILNHSKKIDLL